MANDLIYPAEVMNNCDCNCQHGIYWMPPPPPPDFTPPPPDENGTCCCQYPQYPWIYPSYYPLPPPCYPPPPPPYDPNKPDKPDDPNNPDNPGDDPNKPTNPDDVANIEKQIQALTKKLSVIKCMIENIGSKKSDFIMKTSCCSYNFGNIDLKINGWGDGSYAKTALNILYFEKELIQNKIRELAEKLGDSETDCGCGNCNSVESTVAGK